MIKSNIANSSEDEIDGINILQHLSAHEDKIKRILKIIALNFVSSIFFPILVNIISSQVV